MSTNLQGKVVTISGGASGIGLVAAKMMAKRGAKVSLGDIQEAKLKEAVAAIEEEGGQAMYCVVDVTKRAQTEAWIASTLEKWGKLDGVANMAGVSGKQMGSVETQDISDEDWDFCMEVNARGVMNCMGPQIKAMKSGGSIVNCASLAGVEGLEKYGSYCASKFAVVGLTLAAARELGRKAIRCNVICPGPIKTPMMFEQPEELKDTQIPKVVLERFGEPEEVAELLCWLLCDGSTFMTGTVQRIDGGGRRPLGA
ncbi:3-alpha--hydroxysteroid dehydrogenase [Paraphoma chrysanthemicola]|nr:3-alpha--hydroxysteroid dehydrogenase [Paraphoma chrysanthemicola]